MVGEQFIFRGFGANGQAARPVIVQRTDQAFIPALLNELQRADAPPLQVISPRATAAVTPLKLFQPVQRTFNVALLELACDQFGLPRVDPTRIESAGLVIRRLAVNRDGELTGQQQGWMQSGQQWRGWLNLGTAGQAKHWQEFDPEADPDAARRAPAVSAGQPMLDELLRARLGAAESFSESVAPLFVAPPAVGQATRRTILYGVIPLTSSERSESGTSANPLATREAPYDAQLLEQALPAHLPVFMQANTVPLAAVPQAGQVVTRTDAEGSVVTFTRALRQLQIEFDAFGESAESRALFAQLNQVTLSHPDGDRPFGDFLRATAAVLVDQSSGSIRMPDQWPTISAVRQSGFVQTTLAVLRQRLDEFTSGEGRYDDIRAVAPRQYVLRAFVRLKREGGCPPRLIWSADSEPFTIAPWYESGPAPPTQINLPDATDFNYLKSLKPNVAFVVPAGLANVLNSNSPKDFIEGNAGRGSGNLALDWICGFNIPLITICAFIVLNIFLQLFHIIFQWLFFIKICIPFPRKK